MKSENTYLEHANITVSDLKKAIHFINTAFPEFKIRGGGKDDNKEWVHIGNDYTYLAINALINNTISHHDKNYDKNGFNHIGFVVPNIDSLADRLLNEGYERSYPKQIEEFRIRDYFCDSDGNEVEFVQYLSNNVEERNRFVD